MSQLRGVSNCFLAYTFPACLPDPDRLEVPAHPGVDGAAYRPPRHPPRRTAPCFTRLLRQPGGEGLSPHSTPRRLVAHPPATTSASTSSTAPSPPPPSAYGSHHDPPDSAWCCWCPVATLEESLDNAAALCADRSGLPTAACVRLVGHSPVRRPAQHPGFRAARRTRRPLSDPHMTQQAVSGSMQLRGGLPVRPHTVLPLHYLTVGARQGQSTEAAFLVVKTTLLGPRLFGACQVK